MGGAVWAAGWLTARLGGGQEHPLRTHTTHPHHTPTPTPHAHPHLPTHFTTPPRCTETCFTTAMPSWSRVRPLPGHLPAACEGLAASQHGAAARSRPPLVPSTAHGARPTPCPLPPPLLQARGGVPRRALLHPLRNTPAARQQVGLGPARGRQGVPAGREGGLGLGSLILPRTPVRLPASLPCLHPSALPLRPPSACRGKDEIGLVRVVADYVLRHHYPHLAQECAAALGPEHWVGGQHWTQGCLCRQHWSPGWPPAVPQLAPTPPRRPTAPPRCTNLYLCTPPARPPPRRPPATSTLRCSPRVAQRTGRLFAEWHRVGFVHGTRGAGGRAACAGQVQAGAAGGAWLARRAARRRGAG